MTFCKVAVLFAIAMAGTLPSTLADAQAEPPTPLSSNDDHIRIPAAAPQVEGTVDVGDGVKLWYWDTGGPGQAVVLLHASAGSGEFWGYQQPAFAREGYRLIGYSRRGYFRSDVGNPESAQPGSEDLLKLVDHLKIDRFHIIGSAAGGMVAMDFAASYPQRLLSFVISSSIVGITNTDYKDMQARLYPPEFLKLPTDFKELGPSYRASNPDGVKSWKELLQRSTTGQVRMTFKNTITWDTLEAIRFPVLMLTGDADLYTPPSNARMIAKRIPNAEVAIIQDAGHSPWWERPTEYNKIVLSFLGKVRGRQ